MSTGSGFDDQQGDQQVRNAQDRHTRDAQRAKSAATLLARLMSDKMNADIAPNALRLFLLVYWSRVSELAHTIHDNEDIEAR